MQLHKSVTNWKAIEAFSSLEQRFKLKHKDSYDYKDSLYINSSTKIRIYCNTHKEHFEQTPNNHLKGAGCPKCGVNVRSNLATKTTESFIKEATSIHKNKYLYAKSIYKGSKDKLIITCLEHGDFEQRPNDHLNGAGCPNCKIVSIQQAQRLTLEDFLNRSKKVHNNFYNYSKVKYTGSKTNVTIVCPIHGEFTQNSGHHLKGHGCPACAVTGFDKSKPALLYYFKITDGVNIAWKIGLTNNSINQRYSLKERAKMTEVISVWYKDGQEAYNEEQRILKEFVMHRYKGPKLLSSGNTELFNIDIFTKIIDRPELCK